MKKRRIISAAVVLSGLALFLVIINWPDKNAQKSAAGSVSNRAGDASGLEFQVNRDRNLVTNAASSDNLTDRLAQNLSQNILQMNNSFNSGQGTSTVKLPSPDSLTSMIGQSIGGQSIQFPTFSEKDIRLNPDNSTDAQLAYIKTLGEITKKNFAGFNTPVLTILNNFFEQNNSEALAKYVAIAGNQINDLLALKVPTQLSAWHLQNLNLWEKKLAVYKAILDLNADPLKAALAIQEVNGIGQENESIQKVLNDFAKK